MNRFVILAVAILGSCSTVDVREDPKASEAIAVDPMRSPAGSTQDELTGGMPEALAAEPTTTALTCDGSPGQWAACRGNGCAVCGEKFSSAPCYLFDHPNCTRNDNCAGQYFTCNAACPTPSGADFDCSTCNGTPGQWAGCRGNGCAVCNEKISNAPCYVFNHPKCSRNNTCAGQFFTCNAACPAPSGPDLDCSTCNGTAGQWAGCRGNGCAVCAEKISNAPCYFRNHPQCNRNDTCGGQFFTCNAACPAPSAADINCT